MSQYVFGAGDMTVTPLLDASGAAIVNPSPARLMDLQEASADLPAQIKKLFGQNSFPIGVGVGQREINWKVKPARIYAAQWNALFFGQSITSGTLLANYRDLVGAAIPSTPFQITVTPPSSGTYVCDLGVIDANGKPMQRVASAPATGQYSLNASTGQYTFASADVGKTVYINFQYTASVTGAQKIAVQNLPMGYAPAFKADMSVTYLGKVLTFSMPMCISTKMSIGLKNEDFAVPEFEFSVFDNGTGVVMTVSTSE